MTQNGNHVTWRELNLALDPIKEDVTEIKKGVEALQRTSFFGPRGRKFIDAILIATVASAVSFGLAFLLH